jgi:hypothetical protein
MALYIILAKGYFPPSRLTAIADGTIKQILCAADCDSGFLLTELRNLRIFPREGSDPPLHNAQRGTPDSSRPELTAEGRN